MPGGLVFDPSPQLNSCFLVSPWLFNNYALNPFKFFLFAVCHQTFPGGQVFLFPRVGPKQSGSFHPWPTLFFDVWYPFFKLSGACCFIC